MKSHDTPESQLRTFLPTGDDADDVDEVLAPLFGSGNFQFGNPVDKFKSDVEEGNLSPESQSVRRLFWKSERRNYKAKMKERAYTQLHDMLKARNGFIASLVKFISLKSDLDQLSSTFNRCAQICQSGYQIKLDKDCNMPVLCLFRFSHWQCIMVVMVARLQ